jgi:hypothetical protein
VEIQRHVNLARAALEKCGVDVQIRSINGFSAGALLDLPVNDLNAAGKVCGDSRMTRTPEEVQLLDDGTRRSADTTDLNVYYVRSFIAAGVSPPPYKNAGETVVQDCFFGISDATNSGVVLSASAILEFPIDGVALLVHEITHALIYRPSRGTDEHNDQMGHPYTGSNVMSGTVGRGTIYIDSNQCVNGRGDR